ncbi:flagellar export chaperone FliS [Zobellella denitrificans]|jgi:flagellar secretion chaperone FliS|uniref:Flagellar secretion chaperone FliS n=1 Tax=Zobellella denitrificans TaxID=347534 RepID=A0A231MVL3_9GAMM|nr:flagellar export chaperone FliS [Zobellella denitrificans]ATG74954.1 flagellar biosynthesis protein FliS [Zobellella denitrificans]OXS14261.1 flagellar export chaperone FliS [Zobellella denitrificans]
MFDADSGFDIYQHTQTDARAAQASPRELVLMLMDGLLDEIARAEGHMQAGRIREKGASIAKAIDILGGLDSALDMEQGGELATNLHQLYDYCGRQLFGASVNNDVAQLAPVVRVLQDLREGWERLGQEAEA